MFAEHGFEGTSIEAVLSADGGQPRRAYKTTSPRKEDLCEAVVSAVSGAGLR